jgi:hypothetical protein
MRHDGHIRQRSPGSWEIKYSVGGREYRYLTVRGTLREAKAALREKLESLRHGTHVDPNKLTVGEWLEQWLTTVRQEVSPKTHERYSELVRGYLVPVLGGIALSKLTPTAIQPRSTGGPKVVGGMANQVAWHHELAIISIDCSSRHCVAPWMIR